MQHAVHIILMVLRRTLTIHFLVVVEEVGVDFIQEPLFLCHGLLHKHKSGTRNPI